MFYVCFRVSEELKIQSFSDLGWNVTRQHDRVDLWQPARNGACKGYGMHRKKTTPVSC